MTRILKYVPSLSPNGRFCEKNLFEARDHFYYGRCQSLSVPRCLHGKSNRNYFHFSIILRFVLEFGISELVVTLNTDTDIYVHNRNNFYHPTNNAKVSINIGKS